MTRTGLFRRKPLAPIATLERTACLVAVVASALAFQAGPASAETPAVVQEVVERGPEARIQLVAADPSLVFQRRTAASTFEAVAVGPGGIARGGGTAKSYQDLCGAPCEITLPAGSHTLAIAKGDGEPFAFVASLLCSS
jgi:hypothetical protein